MTDKARVAETRPAPVELDPQENQFWCTCGMSANQPFCDGSHKGSDFRPLVFKVEKQDTYFLCQCKQTSNPPYCDGSHKSLIQKD